MQNQADISFDLEKPYISFWDDLGERTALSFCDSLYHWMVKPEYGGEDLLPTAAYVAVEADVPTGGVRSVDIDPDNRGGIWVCP